MTLNRVGPGFVVISSILIFIHGWYYKSMVYSSSPLALLPWPAILALAAAGLGTILAIARRNYFSKSTTFAFTLMLATANSVGFALARGSTMGHSHFFGPEACWESFEIFAHSFVLGVASIVLSSPFVFILARKRPMSLKMLHPPPRRQK